MDVKITYPNVIKQRVRRNKFLKLARFPVLAAVLICPIVNLLVGGKAWSIIVLMGLYMLWTTLLSPDLVEYNRISQFIKVVTDSCVLLALIDVVLAHGWVIDVIPFVAYGGLFVSGVLFFTDLERQKQNIRPMLQLSFLCIIASLIGVSLWREESRWSFAVMGAAALLLLIICAIVLGGDFIRALKRRFHTK